MIVFYEIYSIIYHTRLHDNDVSKTKARARGEREAIIWNFISTIVMKSAHFFYTDSIYLSNGYAYWVFLSLTAFRLG